MTAAVTAAVSPLEVMLRGEHEKASLDIVIPRLGSSFGQVGDSFLLIVRHTFLADA
jgi:hypothetical protein